MKLPYDFLNPGTYTKPRFFLCDVDKSRMCQLSTTNTQGNFKFNSLSELSFETARIYNDVLSGTTRVNPYFDKIESPRLIEVENFGFFEIQDPEFVVDGIKESKTIKAYSFEYTLSTKYLDDFYINTGKVDSLEVLNASDPNKIAPIVLYNPSKPTLSLLHLALEKIYGWSIGHVDSSLRTLSRQFEIDRMSIYDFLMNEVCEKFNCYIVFDTFDNTINLYAQSLTSKFIGDGVTNKFIISPPFSEIGTVSIDGYKTTRWSYDVKTGTITLEDTPESGVHIEVVDGALTEWETDVFVSFDNLAKEINISYPSDEIKTVLTVTYGDNLDIRETNLGLPYLTDLSYFYTVDWMGKDLYDAYTKYMQKCNSYQSTYTSNSQKMLDIAAQISFAENRLSLEYAVANSVNATTVGKYYVRGGESPNYYYSEVSLPADYVAGTVYYSDSTTNLQDGTDGNVSALYAALQKYFYNYFHLSKISEKDELYSTYKTGVEKALSDILKLESRFSFMDGGSYTIQGLHKLLTNSSSSSDQKEIYISNFFDTMWNQLGKIPLKTLYYEPYKKIQIVNLESNWAQKDHDNYGYYYVVILLLNSIERALAKRNAEITKYQQQYEKLQQANATIGNSVLIENNFTEGQLMRLSAFLREDELHIDDIVETEITTVAESYKLKQDAMESGRIELQKICQPRFQFSMTMANIYAIHEFEPIIHQFQLGNMIKVGLRKDYIKQARLLQVNINFDDFSDFSCDFGELTNIRTQSDIHADLLSQAISAGKSVATNASYWTKGTEQATSIDLRLQEGLLNSIEALKAIEGNQNVRLDNYGLHLEVINPQTGEISDKRVWLVNNQIVFTDDGFKTSKTVLGEFEVGGEKYYGLLAQAVIAGIVEGSSIVGGTIKIGLQPDGSYAFEVHADGSVTMNGGTSISGYAKEDDVNSQINEVKNTATIISDTKPTKANEGQLWLDTSVKPYVLRIYTNGNWMYFDQQSGGKIFTSQPKAGEYAEGDIWVLDAARTIDGVSYPKGAVLKADHNLKWQDAMPDVTSTIANVKQNFQFSADNGLTIGQSDKKFHVNINSKRMGFYDGDTEVVHISNRSANIDNLTVEKNFVVDCESSTLNGDLTMNKTIGSNNYSFSWQIESNGSYSLVRD